MNCKIIPTFRLDSEQVSWILQKLSKLGSAFQCRLANLAELDGHIALVEDMGQIVSWTRTEHWRDMTGKDWQTLEAFTLPTHRRRGAARFAAAGLAAAGAIKVPSVAVFASPMISVAKSSGLYPVLFRLDESGRWVAQ